MPPGLKDIDKGFRAVMNILKKESEEEFEVMAGVIGGRAEAEKEESGDNIASIAKKLEFGTPPGIRPVIPSRPFLRTPFDVGNAKWERIIEATIASAVSKKEDVSGVLATQRGLYLAAEAYVRDVQLAIDARSYAPLAQYTIDRRRTGPNGEQDDLPLVDTGQLRQAIGTRITGQPAEYRTG